MTIKIPTQPKGPTAAGPILDGERVEVPAAIPRHGGNGNPKVRTGSSAKFSHYTRASGFAKVIEDAYNLERWSRRLTVFGMSRRPDLVLAAQAVEAWEDREDKARHDRFRDELNTVVDAALAEAKGDKAARRGTALHLLSERSDAGQDLSYLDADTARALQVWRHYMSIFRIISTETFVVHDGWRVGGSFDRLLELTHRVTIRDGDGEVLAVLEPGTRVVGDLKGLALDTPIPTPTGWTTMGAVEVGEQVLGSGGHPCTVMAKSQTKRIGTYVVTFDDGEQVTCDREHLWWVMTGRGERTGTGLREQVIDVETMRDTLFRYGQRQHRVPVAGPLDLPAVDLPIDPYLLGCWLGDGKTAGGEITKGEDLFEILAADGHELGVPQANHSDKVVTRTVLGLRTALRTAGLLGHKAIPDTYLRGSIEQRTALLRGLMDTDGTWNVARNRAVFAVTDKALAVQVHELVTSLGQRAHLAEFTGHGFGRDVTVNAVEFRPVGFNPFRLPRKAAKVEYQSGARARYRIVKSVEPGPDVETACIAVDSPNRTYLCGRNMVPTHNTGKTSDYFGPAYGGQLAVYAGGVPYVHVTDEAAAAGDDGRRPWPDGVAPSQDWAVIPHVPIDKPDEASLAWVDLRIGRQWGDLAAQVRAARGLSRSAFLPGEVEGLAALPQVLDEAGERDARFVATMLDLISSAVDEAALGELYAAHAADWRTDFTAACAARVEALRAAPPQVELIAALRACATVEQIGAVYDAHEARWTPYLGKVASARAAQLAEAQTAAVGS